MPRVLFVEGPFRPELQQSIRQNPRFSRSAFTQFATYDFMMNSIFHGQGGMWTFDALAIDTQFLYGFFPNLPIPKPVTYYRAQRPEIQQLPVIGLTSLEGAPIIPPGVDVVFNVHQHYLHEALIQYITFRMKRS